MMTSEVDTEALLKHAHGQFRKENYVEVLELATQVLHLNPKHADAWYLRGQAKYGLGNAAGAIGDLSAALAADPNHVPARVKRAEYNHYMQVADLDVLVEQLPAYCQQFHRQYPSINDLPQGVRIFAYTMMEIFVERAWAAEKEERLEDAVKYWQVYRDCGGKIDYDIDWRYAEKRIQRLTWEIAARRGDL